MICARLHVRLSTRLQNMSIYSDIQLRSRKVDPSNRLIVILNLSSCQASLEVQNALLPQAEREGTEARRRLNSPFDPNIYDT